MDSERATVMSMCKICGTEHGNTVCKAITILSAAIRAENGEREKRLRAKCRWEEYTRSKVLKEYGDPAKWN